MKHAGKILSDTKKLDEALREATEAERTPPPSPADELIAAVQAIVNCGPGQIVYTSDLKTLTDAIARLTSQQRELADVIRQRDSMDSANTRIHVRAERFRRELKKLSKWANASVLNGCDAREIRHSYKELAAAVKSAEAALAESRKEEK